MKIYTIEVIETLSRQVEVVAENREEAIKKVEEQYVNCEIVLDSADMCGDTEFNLVGVEEIEKVTY
jgi:hypothetical protein